jgi:coiled-coil domain-containing protein 12
VQTDTVTIAPRKPNWDLKRDVEKKLGRLERATQRAVGELITARRVLRLAIWEIARLGCYVNAWF